MCFDAAFTFTVGHRFPKQASDTLRSWRHIPTYQYADVSSWLAHVPLDCDVVGIELTDDARPLETFSHPQRAVYILGPEDGSLSDAVQARCRHIVQIDSRFCLNVASAGTVVMYDRNRKASWSRSSVVEQRPVEAMVVGSNPVGTAQCPKEKSNK